MGEHQRAGAALRARHAAQLLSGVDALPLKRRALRRRLVPFESTLNLNPMFAATLAAPQPPAAELAADAIFRALEGSVAAESACAELDFALQSAGERDSDMLPVDAEACPELLLPPRLSELWGGDERDLPAAAVEGEGAAFDDLLHEHHCLWGVGPAEIEGQG